MCYAHVNTISSAQARDSGSHVCNALKVEGYLRMELERSPSQHVDAVALTRETELLV